MGKFQEDQKILIYSATIFGLYMPSIKKLISRKWITFILKIMTLVPFLGLSVMLGSYVKNLFWDEGSFLTKTYSVTSIVILSLILFKHLYFNLHHQRFERVFKLWNSSFKEELYSDEREELLGKVKKTTNRYIKILCSVGFGSCILWAVPPFFNPEKKLTHPIGIEYRNQSPDYELVCTYQLVVSLYSGTLGTCFDGVYMVLLSLEYVQLTHLQKCLAQIIDDVQVQDNGQVMIRKNEKFHPEILEKNSIYTEEKRKLILIWISHHQQLLKFHDEIGKIYYVPLCIQFSNIVICLCLVAFLNIVGALTAIETAVSLIFFTGSYCMFYLTCRFGDIINETSTNLFGEAFVKAWYVYPKPLKSIFHIIIMRSQRPMDIVAFDIYPLGARSFFKIFKTAYTFFTMIMQLVKRKDFMKDKKHLTL